MSRPSEDSLLTFIAASLTLVVCFTASSAPIPLMSVYQTTLGLAPDEIANSLVAYYAGCILTLVLFARMSNLPRFSKFWLNINVLPENVDFKVFLVK